MILVKKLNAKIDDIKIVILIVTYNSEQFIDGLLESIAAQDYDLTRVILMVIDNNSSDKTVEKLVSGLSRLDNRIVNVLLIRLERNVGFAPANNIGLLLLRRVLGSLRGRKVVLLNPDTRILDKRFLKTVDEVLEHLPIVGFAMVSGNDDVVDSLGAYVDLLGNSQDILCGVRLSKAIQSLASLMPHIYAVACVCFAAVAIRGEVFELMGLLKDFYVMYFEDTEFCLRAWSRGLPVYIYKDFMIWHARGGTQQMRSMSTNKSGDRGELNIPHHFSKNFLLLAYEYLGPITFTIRTLLYLIASLMLGRKHLVYSLLESLRIIRREKLRWRRLPRGLIPRNPRTWVLLWALKYWLRYGGSIEEAVSYGVRRASLEYVLRYLIPKYGFKQDRK